MLNLFLSHVLFGAAFVKALNLSAPDEAGGFFSLFGGGGNGNCVFAVGF
jgi:hypothetical protein